ncbi:MAG: PQQ-binding-like beta-propeller repeat protein [Spirochaetota bacterium]
MKRTCTRERAVAYVYGIMNAAAAASYEKHAAHCEQCSAHIAAIASIKDIASLGARTLSRTVPPLKDAPSIRISYVPRALAAAAAVLIIITGGVLLSLRTPRPTVISKGAVQPAPAGMPAKSWCFATKGALRTTPTVDGNAVFFGSDDARVYALAPESGSLLWEYRTAGRIASVPIIVGNALYAASADGYVYCLDKKNGLLTWKRAVGTIIFSQLCADKSGVFAATAEGLVVALANDGKQRWQKSLGTPVMSALVGDERAIFFGTRDGVVYALAKNDGSPLWGHITESHFLTSRPRIAGDLVVMGDTDGMVYAIDRARGTLAWRFKTGGAVIADIESREGLIYVASDKVYCVSESGREVWRFAPDTSIDVNCIISPTALTIVDKYNSFYHLHPKSGICMRRETRTSPVLGFAYAGSTLFTAGDDGSLCAVNDK